MIDETLTVPCEGIGVWEGARAVMYDGWSNAQVTVLVAEPDSDGDLWVSRGWRPACVAKPAHIRLDLTHQLTRLATMVRLAEYHGGKAMQGVRWERSESRAWVLRCDDWRMEWSTWNVPGLALLDLESQTVDIDALVAVCQHVWGS